jgi:hypothetical protein
MMAGMQTQKITSEQTVAKAIENSTAQESLFVEEAVS